MEFKKLSEMRKEHFSFKDGKRWTLIDTDRIKQEIENCKEWDRLEGAFSASVLASLVAGKINSEIALHGAFVCDLFSIELYDGLRSIWADIQTERTYIYDRETGKQLYAFVKVSGVRLASFRYGGRYDYHETADFSRVFGRWSLGFASTNSVDIVA